MERKHLMNLDLPLQEYLRRRGNHRARIDDPHVGVTFVEALAARTIAGIGAAAAARGTRFVLAAVGGAALTEEELGGLNLGDGRIFGGAVLL